MLLNLTDLSDEPLQSQVVRQIRAKILSGQLRAGTPLPSIRSLAREHHVSVITVQRAYETLLRDSLILSRRGKGFFISDISTAGKKKFAESILRENLQRPISAALAEGLSQSDILTIVKDMISTTSTKE